MIQASNRTCNRFINNPRLKEIKPRELLAAFGKQGEDVFSPESISPAMRRAFGELNFNDLFRFLNLVCGTPEMANTTASMFSIEKVLIEYQDIIGSVRDVREYRTGELPGITIVRDRNGKVVGEIFGKEARREWIHLKDVPKDLIHAIVSAEDQNFYSHKGIDENGILRAFLKGFSGGRLEGGSTITQQLAKNLIVGNAISLKRKFSELVAAYNLERELGKQRILELYLNIIFMGQNSWGVKLASQTYFGKEVGKLTLSEMATLAGLIRWPASNNPITSPSVAKNRRDQVLDAMLKVGYIDIKIANAAKAQAIKTKKGIPTQFDDRAQYFVSAVNSEKNQKKGQLTLTLDSQMQNIATQALRDGIEKYEAQWRRAVWDGPVGSLLDKELPKKVSEESKPALAFLRKKPVEKTKPQLKTESEKSVIQKGLPTDWQNRLENFRVPVSSLDWLVATVLNSKGELGFIKKHSRENESYILKTSAANLNKLKIGDVIYVKKTKTENEFQLAFLPRVNGSVLIMDVRTGEVLAMVGGYARTSTNQFNRALYGLRQPGSVVKSFTFMAGLEEGYQPNQIIEDTPIELMRYGKVWRPANFDRSSLGYVTFRYALEHSLNTVTVRLMSWLGLDTALSVMKDFGVYDSPLREYSVVLGSQETTLLRLTTAYAQISNGGFRLTPQLVKSTPTMIASTDKLNSVDDTTLAQIRSLLQGVVLRGTAVNLRKYGSILGGKTGTSNFNKDVWFVGFTPNIAIGVFVGYDKPESLSGSQGRGGQATGSSVALPIFTQIFEALVKEKRIDLKMGFEDLPGAIVEKHEVPVMNRYANLQKSEPTIVDLFRKGKFDPLQRLELYRSEIGDLNQTPEEPGIVYEQEKPVVPTPNSSEFTERLEAIPNSMRPEVAPPQRPDSQNNQIREERRKSEEGGDSLWDWVEEIRKDRENRGLRN